MSIAGIVKLILAPPPPTIKATPFSVISEIRTHLGSVKDKGVPSPTKIYRASELSKMCPREEVLRYLHEVRKVEQIEPKLQVTFDFGNAFNDLAQNKWLGEWNLLIGDWVCQTCKQVYLFQKKPKRCDKGRDCCGGTQFIYRELEFIDHEAAISGHPDGILEKNGKKTLLELKTCNSKIFKYITEISKTPLDFHVDQIHIYMWRYQVFEGIILYLNKDESEMKEFNISYNRARMDRLQRNVRLARDGMKTKVLPPREICSKIDCGRAKKCQVKQFCFEVGESSKTS